MTEFLNNYNLLGLAIGLATFLVIGLFHPLVIKGEYYFGVKIWKAFLSLGIACCLLACIIDNIFWSTIMGVLDFPHFGELARCLSNGNELRKDGFPKIHATTNRTKNSRYPTICQKKYIPLLC